MGRLELKPYLNAKMNLAVVTSHWLKITKLLNLWLKFVGSAKFNSLVGYFPARKVCVVMYCFSAI